MSHEFNKIWIDFDVSVSMRDGIRLSADIYRPLDSKDGVRYPCILLRTPYNKNTPSGIENVRWFAARGYAVVFMDVRGRGDSDGEFTPYFSEGKDGYDSIEWCAAQPWCDGHVGTLGGSYLGRIQWLAALEHPPHLKAMAVSVSPSDPFVEWPTGTTTPMHLCWLHYTSGRLNQHMENVDWDAVYWHLPLVEMDGAAGRTSRVWRDECQHPQMDAYWQPLCYQTRFAELDLPVLHVSGWYDDEQVGTPLNYAGMTRAAAGSATHPDQKMVMGPWGHAINTTQRLGEVDFGPQSLINLREVQLDWFDRHLKNRAPQAELTAPVRIFIMGENRWRDEQEWPLARTQWQTYYLHSQGRANSRFGDGELSRALPGSEPADHFSYDPARPFPFITEPTSSQIGGPDDYAALHRRDDVLVYTTPVLEEDTEVTGPIKLELFAATSALDTDFMAMLVDIHPTGFVQRLCDGMVRGRFRQGMHQPELLQPGETYRFEIDLWNTSQLFQSGHRIGLAITSSAFPKYDRNLNNGEDLTHSTRMVVAHQTVFHDALRPSALVLPIIPRNG